MELRPSHLYIKDFAHWTTISPAPFWPVLSPPPLSSTELKMSTMIKQWLFLCQWILHVTSLKDKGKCLLINEAGTPGYPQAFKMFRKAGGIELGPQQGLGRREALAGLNEGWLAGHYHLKGHSCANLALNYENLSWISGGSKGFRSSISMFITQCPRTSWCYRIMFESII